MNNRPAFHHFCRWLLKLVVAVAVLMGFVPRYASAAPSNTSPIIAAPAPTVSHIDPASGTPSGGTEVTIYGANFAGGANVSIGGTAATNIVVVASNRITATTPAHAVGDADVVVMNADDQSGTLVNGFVYQTPRFIDVSVTAGVDFLHHRRATDLMPLGAGVVVFDFNGDDLPDIFIPDSDGPSALYRNNGDGTFTNVAAEAGVDDPLNTGKNGGCAADYLNRGHQDLFVTGYGTSKLYRNNGDGTFTDVTAVAGVGDPDPTYRTTGCAWGDYDGDGFLDLVVVRHLDESDPTVFTTRRFETAVRRLSLYHNNGDGTFTEVTSLLGDITPPTDIQHMGASSVFGAGFQPVWVDVDNDGHPDLYVCNDFGREIQPNRLWHNNGDGTFTDVSAGSGADRRMFCMGLAVGDYNGDGFLDFYGTNIGDNVLLRNNHATVPLTFSDATGEAGVGIGHVSGLLRITWGAVFFDYDNDGYEDLYVVSGFLDSDTCCNAEMQPNVLLRNNGDGTFTNISNNSGADDPGIGRGGVYLDFNDDGCLDLFVANFGQRAKLFQNVCDYDRSWLVVKPEGTISNRDGIGARITVVAGGKTQIREIASGSSHMSQNMREAHFGLGDAALVDSVTIRWPSGIVQVLTDLAVNRRLTIMEPGVPGTFPGKTVRGQPVSKQPFWAR